MEAVTAPAVGTYSKVGTLRTVSSATSAEARRLEEKTDEYNR